MIPVPPEKRRGSQTTLWSHVQNCIEKKLGRENMSYDQDFDSGEMHLPGPEAFPTPRWCCSVASILEIQHILCLVESTN